MSFVLFGCHCQVVIIGVDAVSTPFHWCLFDGGAVAVIAYVEVDVEAAGVDAVVKTTIAAICVVANAISTENPQ